MPICLPVRSAASRARETFSAWSSAVPCEKLKPEDVGAGLDQLGHALDACGSRARWSRRSSCGGGSAHRLGRDRGRRFGRVGWRDGRAAAAPRGSLSVAVRGVGRIGSVVGLELLRQARARGAGRRAAARRRRRARARSRRTAARGTTARRRSPPARRRCGPARSRGSLRRSRRAQRSAPACSSGR